MRQGFTGTELLLYGAILDPDGQRARARLRYRRGAERADPADPSCAKSSRSSASGSMPTAPNSVPRRPTSRSPVSRPIEEIVDDAHRGDLRTRASTISSCRPSGSIDPEEQARFTAGLVDLRKRQGLYKEDPNGVRISEQVLYQARISLPSNVQTGRYTAETFAITHGRVVASAMSEVEVKKVGLRACVAGFAQHSGFLLRAHRSCPVARHGLACRARFRASSERPRQAPRLTRS